MPAPELDKIIEANERRTSYHFVVTISPRLAYEGDASEAKEVARLQMAVTREESVFKVDFYTYKDGAYVERGTHDLAPLKEPIAPPYYLQSFIRVLRANKVQSITEENQMWKVDCTVEDLPILQNPERFYESLYERLGGVDDKVLKRSVEFVQSLGLSLTTHLYVSHDTLQIERATVDFSSPKLQPANVTFSDAPANFEADILTRIAKVEPSSPPVPFAALLVRFPNLGGWSNATHAYLAQQSLDLVQARDGSQRYAEYAELYDPMWTTHDGGTYTYYVSTQDRPLNNYHPTVIGAWHEDNGCKEDKFPEEVYDAWFAHAALDSRQSYRFNREYYLSYGCRDFNHYGGEDVGISNDTLGPGSPVWNDELVEFFHGPKPHLPSGSNSYYSAKQWAYGGDLDDSRDQLTFLEAINQYGCYSFEGKRAAYLILGHVLHLLQDSSQPDHAKRMEHPGSSKTQGWMCDRVCAAYAGVMGLAACALCFLGCLFCMITVGGAAELTCEALVDRDALGYEALIRDKWLRREDGTIDTDAQLSLQQELNEATVDKLTSFDEFYARLSRKAIELAQEIPGVDDSPLGCGQFPLLPELLGNKQYIPNIHQGQYGPYFDLMHQLALQIVPYGARFLEYFYEIVNYPPFVEHVIIKSGRADLGPLSFGQLSNEQGSFDDCTPCKKVYEAKWETPRYPHGDTPTRDLNLVVSDQSVPPDRPAYIFVRFGPTIAPVDPAAVAPVKSKRVTNPTVTFVGPLPAGAPQSITLNEAEDGNGYYYWQTFTPVNPADQHYGVTLQIDARDTSAHLDSRGSGIEGYLLDSQPDTVAIVDVNTPPLYPFVEGTYAPGLDTVHQITIAARAADTPVGWEEPNDSFETSTRIAYDPDTKQLQQVLHGLTIDKQNDADYFIITYCATAADGIVTQNDQIPGHKNCSGGSIIEFCTIPPMLIIKIDEDFDNCLDINFFDLQHNPLPNDVYPFQYYGTGHANYRIMTPNTALGESVVRGNVHGVYVCVTSHNFDVTGPLRYTMGVAYKPTTVEPVSHGELTTENWFINHSPQLRAQKWLPDPPPDIKELIDEVEGLQLVVYDVGTFVTQVETNVDSLVDAMGITDVQMRANAKGDILSGLGHVARDRGRLEVAEHEFNQGAERYNEGRNKSMEVNALSALRDVLHVQGKVTEAESVAQRIRIILEEGL